MKMIWVKEREDNMHLIEELVKKINSNNMVILMNLSDIITSNKFQTLEELVAYEDKKFTVDKKVLTNEERIKRCMEILDSSPYEYDDLDSDQIDIYKKYRKILDDGSSSIDDKILSIIVLFSLTHRELYFPYEAYKYIIDSRI